jgi:asparagine synthase (glutamine-hydrolysing)
MCGIAGIYSYGESAAPINYEVLIAMRDQMLYRGPDGFGIWTSKDGTIGLGHRRLSIIDISDGGSQPMSIEGGRYLITFNGEIYNYRELRSELKSHGIQFDGDSDTEVILRLYSKYGEGVCKKLRGMFAFAIWDNDLKELFLARDSFGIKPLYFNDENNCICFSSQVKSLLIAISSSKEKDPAGYVGYQLWGHIPDPYTLFKGIKSLEPGTWMKINQGGYKKIVNYESLYSIFLDENGNDSQYTSLNAALEDSVFHHMISDVPVGVFLSAGIDSAVLTALASKLGGDLKTVTLAFEEYKGTLDDESVLAEEVSRIYNTRHITKWISKKDFTDISGDFFSAMDQPSTDGLNTWLVSKVASNLGIKVMLSGLGGDEFFGGYPSFKQLPRIRSVAGVLSSSEKIGVGIRKLTSPIFKNFTSVKYAGIFEYGKTLQGAYLLRRALHMPWEIGSNLNMPQSEDINFLRNGLEILMEEEEKSNNLIVDLEKCGGANLAISYLEANQYMRSRLLRDSDWAGMAHSLEIRVPYVDKKLLRYLIGSAKSNHFFNKGDLSRCPSTPLPFAVTNRPKTGFSVPTKEWLVGARPNLRVRGLRNWSSFVLNKYCESLN